MSNPLPPSDHIWASDGSCIDMSNSSNSVTSALVGPLQLTYRILGMNASSNHGEILVLIMGALLGSSFSSTSSSTSSSSISTSSSSSHFPYIIYSDHLHSIRLIKDIQSNTLPPNFWAFRPARSYYKWLSKLLDENPQLSFKHVKSHTSSSDTPSILN